MEDKKGLFSSIAEQLDKYNDERLEEIKTLLNEVLERVARVEERLDGVAFCGEISKGQERDSVVDEQIEDESNGELDGEPDVEPNSLPNRDDEKAFYEYMNGEEELENDGEDESEEEDLGTEEDIDKFIEEEDGEEGGEIMDDDVEEDEEDEDLEDEEDEESEFVDEEEDDEEFMEEEKDDDDEDAAAPDWYDWEVDYPQQEVSDLVSSMGLNDKMQFINELFDGDSELFTETMQALDGCNNFKEVKAYLMESFAEWNFRSDLVYNFMMHLRRKFH